MKRHHSLIPLSHDHHSGLVLAQRLILGRSAAPRSVVFVDDSIVRGTTSRKIVAMIKAAVAREVHMRISCRGSQRDHEWRSKDRAIDAGTSWKTLA